MRNVGIGIEPIDALAKLTLHNYTALDRICKEMYIESQFLDLIIDRITNIRYILITPYGVIF